jgi:hypothetical protein
MPFTVYARLNRSHHPIQRAQASHERRSPLGDEIYIMAAASLKSLRDFPQIENGVGWCELSSLSSVLH